MYHPILASPTLYILVKLLTLTLAVMLWWFVNSHAVLGPPGH